MSSRKPSRLFVLAERVEGEDILSNYFNPQAIARVGVRCTPDGDKSVQIQWLSGHTTKLDGEAAKSFLEAFE